MKRNQPKAEEVFYDGIVSIIKGKLIDNPNLKTDYYHKGCPNGNQGNLHTDIKRFGKEILERMEETKHLITLDPAETHGPDLLTLLKKAEAFIAGFEGDEMQEGIDELLVEIRAGINKCESK